MKYITKDSLAEALHKIGVSSGDTLLVHSDISTIGTIENYSRERLMQTYYDAFMAVLGTEGTLCVPAYFYEYGRFHEPYDIKLSPVSKSLGVFSQYIASLDNSKRSISPIAAISAIGKNAEYICNGHNRHTYGIGSPWDKLYNLNAKMLFLGIDTQPMTFIHYIEYRVGIPHMYNKIYEVPVYNNGIKIFDGTIAYVRYLHYGIAVDSKRKHPEMVSAGLVKTLNYCKNAIHLTQMQPVFEYYQKKLYQNPYHLLIKKPDFVEGEPPYDNPTGPLR